MPTINVGGYDFEGPFTSTSSLRAQSGVYAILTGSNGSWTVVDIGEAQDVKSRVDDHDRADCWKRNNRGTLAVAALYTSESSRMVIEGFLRQKYNPACGVR